jgi:hypothetical protein
VWNGIYCISLLLPVDFAQALLFQVFVGGAKMVVAKETLIGRQG